MVEDRVQRRLAAILAADVAGYSRLMGVDEEGTFAALTAHRTELFGPSIAKHGGRVVKTTGDGVLAEFASVVDAVRCAIAVQEGMTERNTDIPGNRRIEFRMGVNLGDVIVQDDDVYGDGVNVAARLEALAEPGGICVSGDVYRQCRGKIEFTFADLGQQRLKNIAEPVQVWSWLTTSQKSSPANEPAAAEAVLSRPAIAVLPFKNLSGESDQEYFADGVSEDIIAALSRNRWLTVIARNSSFIFKGEAVDLREVGNQLGVRYVLDGSVRKGGDRVRIAAQLIDTSSGNQIWAEKYDRVLEDIFLVQDEVTESIVAAIAPELGKAEQHRAKSKKTGKLSAWEVYQRGMWHLYRRTKEDLRIARGLFAQALSLDPELAIASAGLVDACYYEVVLGLAKSAEENRTEALKAARHALELDPDDAASYCAMGKARVLRQEHEQAIPDLQLAIQLNPSLAWAHYGLGAAAVFLGDPDRAIRHLENAIRLSPRDQHMGSFMVRLAEAHLLKDDYEGAAIWAHKALQQQGFQWSRYAALLAALGFMGRQEEARQILQECIEQRPDFSVSMVRSGHLYTNMDALNHYLDGLRKAGVPE